MQKCTFCLRLYNSLLLPAVALVSFSFSEIFLGKDRSLGITYEGLLLVSLVLLMTKVDGTDTSTKFPRVLKKAHWTLPIYVRKLCQI